jgi:hypothetical protein
MFTLALIALAGLSYLLRCGTKGVVAMNAPLLSQCLVKYWKTYLLESIVITKEINGHSCEILATY